MAKEAKKKRAPRAPHPSYNEVLLERKLAASHCGELKLTGLSQVSAFLGVLCEIRAVVIERNFLELEQAVHDAAAVHGLDGFNPLWAFVLPTLEHIQHQRRIEVSREAKREKRRALRRRRQQ